MDSAVNSCQTQHLNLPQFQFQLRCLLAGCNVHCRVDLLVQYSQFYAGAFTYFSGEIEWTGLPFYFSQKMSTNTVTQRARHTSKVLIMLESFTGNRRRLVVQLSDPYHMEVKAEPSYPANTNGWAVEESGCSSFMPQRRLQPAEK